MFKCFTLLGGFAAFYASRWLALCALTQFCCLFYVAKQPFNDPTNRRFFLRASGTIKIVQQGFCRPSRYLRVRQESRTYSRATKLQDKRLSHGYKHDSKRLILPHTQGEVR